MPSGRSGSRIQLSGDNVDLSMRVEDLNSGQKPGRRSEMRALGVASVLSVGLALALGACGSSTRAAEELTGKDIDHGRPAAEVTEKDFDRENFSHPTNIDNQWFPLAPGTQFILQGRSNRGHGLLPHRVVFTVTDLTKVIDGVRTLVMWDRDYNGGRLLEGELTFHAQDDDGNVWNFGEYPEQYERGKLSGAPDTWIAGLAGARAGILMRGEPRVGTPSYRQGWAPAIEFGDRAKVFKTGQKSCVPFDCYEDVLVTDETNPFEPSDGHQRKYYAAGVGNIRAVPAGGKEREVLVLVRVLQLGPGALARVRDEALKLDKRAYGVSKDVYRRTKPVDHTLRAGQSP